MKIFHEIQYYEARSIYAEWYDEIQMSGFIWFKKIVESNPGFETFFKISENDKTIITINNIDDINYLKNIEIYIDAVFKIIFKQFTKSKFSERIKIFVKKQNKWRRTKEIDDIRDNDIQEEKIGDGKIQWDASPKDNEIDISEDSESSLI